MFFNAILALSLRALLVWENKRLDRKYETSNETERGDPRGGEVTEDTNGGDESYGKAFRYIL